MVGGVLDFVFRITELDVDVTMILMTLSLSLFLMQVEFSISDKQRPGQQIATCVRLLGRNSNSKRLLGYVATLKDNFGFIETANHDKEIFFHYR